MICFLPCAGFGTRMGELTQSKPKPLLTINGRSLLEINLRFAYSYGIRDFVVNTHYLAEQIEDEVKKFSGMNIQISWEKEKILGTAGGIKRALSGRISNDESFLVINPDAIFYPSPRFRLPDESNRDILLYLSPIEPKSKNTELALENGKIHFQDGGYYYIGMSLMKLKVLDSINVGEVFELTDIFKTYSAKNELHGKLFPGSVLDLGDKEKYLNHLDTVLPDYVNGI